MSDEQRDRGPADDVHQRSQGSPWRTRLLLEVDRGRLTAAMALFVLLGVVAVDGLGWSSLPAATAVGDPVQTLFQGLVASIITGVTLVVTISQLVLSQELGAVGDQWERMQDAMDFRGDVEDHLGLAAAPPEPSAFLRGIALDAADRARDLVDTAEDNEDPETVREVRDFGQSTVDNAQDVADQLEDAQFGTFAVVFAAMDLNYSWKIHRARWMRERAEPPVADATKEALTGLEQTLRLFAPAREHFKTLYFEWELVNLSRRMIALSLPALVVAISVLLYFEEAMIPPTTLLGVHQEAWLLGLCITVAVLPFLLLLSHILRIVTVAKLTLAMGPFILRSTDRQHTIRR